MPILLILFACIAVEDILTALNTKSSVNSLRLLVTLFCHHLLGVHESPLLVGRIILIVEKVQYVLLKGQRGSSGKQIPHPLTCRLQSTNLGGAETHQCLGLPFSCNFVLHQRSWITLHPPPPPQSPYRRWCGGEA